MLDAWVSLVLAAYASMTEFSPETKILLWLDSVRKINTVVFQMDDLNIKNGVFEVTLRLMIYYGKAIFDCH